ncbi:MAG TPA: hydrolase [Thermoanaerobaculia bacterium]|nr:hydrolase [Thermoanaerobaculia bacterium]
MTRLDRNSALLLVVDVQEKLMPVIDSSESTIRNIARLIEGCKILGVPIVVTEQYSKGLGHTVPALRDALGDAYRPVEKDCFSALSSIDLGSRKQVLVCGVETHVCVYQTASDLLRSGHEVTLVADALSSRTAANKHVALERLQRDGAHLSSTEMCLFEMTVRSGTDEFRSISRLVK